MERSRNSHFVTMARTLIIVLGLAAVGVALAAAGIYIGETDDAPGAAVIGLLLMVGALVFAARIALRRPQPGENKR